jgi:phosphoribosylformimino-5-aminoimidazole carboxamide ribotide isomerase
MLIPSIDLMDGKIVQLVQGERKKLEFSNFKEWIERFRPFPLVQLIDLDAAMGQGANSALVSQIVEQLPCQVGGGIHSMPPPRSAPTVLRSPSIPGRDESPSAAGASRLH